MTMALLGLLLSMPAQAQQADAKAEAARLKILSRTLDSLARVIPGLNHNSDLALSDVPLHDYIRSLGKVHQINVYIDDMPNVIITNDFVSEPVKSIFLFICKKFNLTVDPVGTILNFVPWEPPVVMAPPPKPKNNKIDVTNGLVSFDMEADSLQNVVRKLSRITGETIITKPGAKGIVSGYIPPSEFKDALENFMFMNGFSVQKHRKGFYMIDRIAGAQPGRRPGRNNNNPGTAAAAQGPRPYSIEVARDTLGGGFIFLTAEDKKIDEILRDLFAELEMEYFLFDAIEGTTTLNIEGAQLDEVLKNLLRGTEYTYKNDRGVYLIGKREMEGLRQTRIVNLKYRPTESVIELLPAQMKEGVELKEFVELNRIIVSGASEQIREVEQFILEIDRPVPMVKIEMVVVDVDFNRLLQAGVRAGLFQPGDSAGAVKSLFPGLDYALDGTAINTILASSGIPALANVGMLRSNFYLQLQAQESRGLLKVVTRPVISTLNGNEASITIGQTDYYRLETNTASNGAVNAFTQVSQRFETIEINTQITVKPLVSQDGMVTLELNPDFTSPGAQADPNIPPTILTRSFQSTIRVKDGETVVLGGLSRESTSNTTDGLPLLARIPVLKWIFGNNSRNKSRSSLIIYITPTIDYN